MDLGSFVREKRRALNLTQGQLAERAGVGLNFVYQLEKNKATVQLDCTRQVLQALGFTLSVSPLPVARSGADTGGAAAGGRGEFTLDDTDDLDLTASYAARPVQRLPWD